MNISRGIENTPPAKPASRKRKNKKDNWKRNKRRRRVNLGFEHKSDKTGKDIPSKTLGPPCDCPNKCWNIVKSDAETIFNSFWDIGNYEAENNYLMQSIKMLPIKRQYV